MSDLEGAGESAELVDSERKEDKIERRQINLLYGSMIGVDLIVLQVFISLGVPDRASFVSVLAFAIGLPLLAAYIYVINDPTIKYKQLIRGRKLWGMFLAICLVIGFLASLVGLSAAFWHISQIAGIVFFVSGFFAAIVVLLFLGIFSKSTSKE